MDHAAYDRRVQAENVARRVYYEQYQPPPPPVNHGFISDPNDREIAELKKRVAALERTVQDLLTVFLEDGTIEVVDPD